MPVSNYPVGLNDEFDYWPVGQVSDSGPQSLLVYLFMSTSVVSRSVRKQKSRVDTDLILLMS